MKKITLLLLLCCLPLLLAAKEYYVATNGNDSNAGTKEAPFATLKKVQSLVKAGDVVYIRGGVYQPTEADIMGTMENIYACVFLLDKSGTKEKPIGYYGYPGERPVFDLSQVKPADKRISVFYVSGSYLHLKNIEVTGTQVTQTGHTQSECFSNRGGSHNIYENLSMHHGMAIGFYLVKGGNNLVLNCDAYENFDSVSEGGKGGNVDGFGAHPRSGDTGNVFRGCRAWWNSDDGFDLINSGESVTIDQCWAFYNGYRPGTFESAADGNGLKAGGYGMSDSPKAPDVIPMHVVTNCLAYHNKAGGIYSNHHLGGNKWLNNTAYDNRWNYNMVNRKSKEEAVDVGGYGHILKNNLSYMPREKHIRDIDYTACTLHNNSFHPEEMFFSASDFESVDAQLLVAPRKEDGSLPELTFLKPKAGSTAHSAKMGYTFPATEDEYTETKPDANIDEWLMEAAIVLEGTTARIAGPNAGLFTQFFVNGQAAKMSNGTVDLTAYRGEEEQTLELKASSKEGALTKLTIKL